MTKNIRISFVSWEHLSSRDLLLENKRHANAQSAKKENDEKKTPLICGLTQNW